MVAGVALNLQLLDAFYAFGMGIILGAGYTFLCALLPGGKLALAIADMAVFIVGFFMLVGFSVTFSYTGTVRWFTFLPMAGGCLLFVNFFWATVQSGANSVKRLMLAPLKFIWVKLFLPVKCYIFGVLAKISNYFKQKAKKIQKKLHKKPKILYNSNYISDK